MENRKIIFENYIVCIDTIEDTNYNMNMDSIFLKEAQVKRVSIEKLDDRNDVAYDKPIEGSYEDDWIEITPDVIASIKTDYELAKKDFYNLSEAFRNYCIDEGFTTFDFETEESYGHTYGGSDEDIFLDLLYMKDIKKGLKGTDDEEVKELAAQYIYTTGVYILEDKVDEMLHGSDWTLGVYRWLEGMLLGTTKGRVDYKKFLYECANTAIADAYENEDEVRCSIVANALGLF